MIKYFDTVTGNTSGVPVIKKALKKSDIQLIFNAINKWIGKIGKDIKRINHAESEGYLQKRKGL